VRSRIAIALAWLCVAAPASAQFNTYYSGTERRNGTSVPATAQFSVEKGRVAVIMKGSRSSRMIFLEKQGVLRVVDEGTKTYFDLDKQSAQGGPMDQMEKQLAQMPPEQRKMAEQMMGSMEAAKPKPTTYVWTKEKQTVKGYEATKVECMVGDQKRSEYWGTKSADFAMTPDERNTMLAMQGYLRNFMIGVKGSEGDGSSRAFQWDTSVDGYPIITRCFDHGDTTLDLKLDRFDRKPLDKDLFETSGFKKQDFMGDEGMGDKKGHMKHMRGR
jgi:hypothetical protein